ncbi:hypothetical protein PPYR_07590 [Photinus pyralis]|uniref:DUF5641 domain-containing protein n=1 Tax=Photinus pyralis TaxID=7054 RepID=A0A5N4AQV6_PHOPY|nr:hypothetical protein PPYR_07590 [Photinus pyralis]
MTNVTNLILNLNHDESLKTLGVGWAPSSDLVQYNAHMNSTRSIVTKRFILANVSQIFDPLGLVGPVTAIAKLLMQDIWKLRIGWDVELSQNLKHRWEEISSQLLTIGVIKIPRCVATDPTSSLELHGFSDASVRAYGACIYIREILLDNSVRCQLLCAKSRIASLKTLTLPKLELCAALLLTDLFSDFIFNKFSTFETLIRVAAFCKRFINNCRDKSKKAVEDNAPSRHWKLGRVTKVHPGPDNVVRAATIKTSHGEVKRPSVRLCVLPTN